MYNKNIEMKLKIRKNIDYFRVFPASFLGQDILRRSNSYPFLCVYSFAYIFSKDIKEIISISLLFFVLVIASTFKYFAILYLISR